jgi:predicted CXXCH cytochrome family protein
LADYSIYQQAHKQSKNETDIYRFWDFRSYFHRRHDISRLFNLKEVAMKKQKRKTTNRAPAFQAVSPRMLSRFKLLLIAFFAVLLISAIFFLSGKTSAQKNNSCLDCHSKLEGNLGEPAKLFENDIHKSRNLSCNDCHGGDPTKEDKQAAKSPFSGYLGKPKPADIPAFCGKCHSDASVMKRFNPSLRVDQVQEYFTSVHGTRLKAGDPKVATCISCHGIHGIRSHNDSQSTVYALNVAETCAKCHGNAEYMQGYDIPHNQYEKYKASVHYKAMNEKQDLSAPTCNDCHGNHGAVPPGVASVANVCGQCHSRQSALFQNSPHKAAFDKIQVGECIRCHNNHDILKPNDEMLGVGQSSVCTSCHNGDKGFSAAEQMSVKITGFQNRIHEAAEILERAERAGMEVSRPKFELKDATDALTQARVVIHSSSIDELDTAIAPGLEVTTKTYQAGQAAFAELNFRRKGLAVSLVFILFLAFLVYLKVRQIEQRESLTSEN